MWTSCLELLNIAKIYIPSYDFIVRVSVIIYSGYSPPSILPIPQISLSLFNEILISNDTLESY